MALLMRKRVDLHSSFVSTYAPTSQTTTLPLKPTNLCTSPCHHTSFTAPLRRPRALHLTSNQLQQQSWAMQQQTSPSSTTNKQTREVEGFTVGDKVRVRSDLEEPLEMYHLPGSKNQPVDVSGMSGEILSIAPEGIDATNPIIVGFKEPKKFRGHFSPEEIEKV